MKQKKAQGKIYWHPTFYNGIQLEFYPYHHKLFFEDEHQLSLEPLRIDILVIKKESGIKINKNIGRIFKDHNIIEFKPANDSLGVKDYIKVMAYAGLYSTFEKVLPTNITANFVINRYPRKLFKYLKNERGLMIKEVESGIYYIEGDAFEVQIIECKKLSEQENLYLKSIRGDLTPLDVKILMEDLGKHANPELSEAYAVRIVEANPGAYEEAMNMMSEETFEIFDRIGAKTGMKDKWTAVGIEKGIRKGKAEKQKETALKMLQDSLPVHKIAKYVEMPVTWVESLIE